jgi:hypothetical protein
MDEATGAMGLTRRNQQPAADSTGDPDIVATWIEHTMVGAVVGYVMFIVLKFPALLAVVIALVAIWVHQALRSPVSRVLGRLGV